jgi:hypothetical protein
MNQAIYNRTLEAIDDNVNERQKKSERHIDMEKATKWLQRYMKKIRKLKNKQ